MRIKSIILASLLSFIASAGGNSSQRLTILHSNDVHGHLLPCSYPAISSLRSGNVISGSMMAGNTIGAFDLPARRDIGGIARRATLAARTRAELAKRGTPVWLIDAGDIFFYGAFSNEYRYQEQLLPVTSETPEDPALKAVLDKLWAPYAAKYDVVLATATADFADRGDDFSQNNFFADAVRAEFGAEVEFEGLGGVHWPIVAGPVTRAMLVDVDQNTSTVVTFRMKGSEIRRFVQQSAPICSGLRYRMVFGQIQDITVGDAPLDDARVYSCAANPSQASRMNGSEMLDKKDTKRPWSEVVIDAIRKAKTITPAYDGRCIVVETPRSAGRTE